MTRIDRLYILTASLLLAHQIDSAYWREWNLFGLPGGVQAFVLLNVAIMLPFLGGLVRLTKGARDGVGFAVALAFIGVATFFIHVWFVLRGHPEFRLPASWLVLCGGLLSSLALGIKGIRQLRRSRR